MYEYRVKKVLKVVDGDTIDVDIDLGFNVSYTQRVRLAGIDTPESRTKDLKEKALGLESKDHLSKHLKDALTVTIKTEKPDSSEKYGRILGWLYINEDAKSLNELMIEQGYAWTYDGGTKEKDFDELLKKRKQS
jgi:micrococcal nuclease